MHRLAVVERLVRNPSAAAELYKISHDYTMGKWCLQLGICCLYEKVMALQNFATGGRKKTNVPFTWIIKLKNVLPVHWSKQVKHRS